MLYVIRDEQGVIVGLSTMGTEELDVMQPGVKDFLRDNKLLAAGNESVSFTTSDLRFIRVLEDLIDVLVQKNVVHLTDLPEEAVQKLQERTKMRTSGETWANIIGDE